MSEMKMGTIVYANCLVGGRISTSRTQSPIAQGENVTSPTFSWPAGETYLIKLNEPVEYFLTPSPGCAPVTCFGTPVTDKSVS